MRELIDEIGRWQRETFTEATQASIIAHLQDEVNNELKPECDPGEIADCLMLLFGLALLRGLDVEQLLRDKFEVNRKRLWGLPNEQGYVEHLDRT